MEAEPQEFIEHENRVVVPVWLHARARFTGIKLELFLVHVWTLEGSKITRHHLYRDKPQALEAL
jgi:ketosteroid isomerase-like protein